MASVVEETCHFQVRFLSSIVEYAIKDTPFSLPGTVGCSELNALINGVLFENKDNEEHLSFDFLINGELLRSTLSHFVEEKRLSTENVIEIEYIVQQESPTLEKSLLHDDWVSSLDICQNCILSGSYDHVVRIWNKNGECLSALEGHTAAVKSVAWAAKGKDTFVLLSASHDQTIMLWQWSKDNNLGECIHICKGHAGSVDCLAVDPDGLRFYSGSWDSMIKVWSAVPDLESASEPEESEGISRKKHKGNKNKRKATTRTPLQTLAGHREAVSSIQWIENNEICSGGWDHCIRIWDLETGSNKNTLTGNKVINSISYSKHSRMVASGSTDKTLRIWDPRSREGLIVKSSLSSHNGWISSVTWSPDSQYELISGSYDLTTKVWDTRSPNKPLFNLEGHQDKVMCVNWTNPELILTGGADNQLLIHRYAAGRSKTSEIQ